jgi:hypothetical protein
VLEWALPQQVCAHVGWGEGAKLACLQAQAANLTAPCKKELFRNEVRSRCKLRSLRPQIDLNVSSEALQKKKNSELTRERAWVI